MKKTSRAKIKTSPIAFPSSAVLSAVGEGVLVVDPAGTHRYANEAAARMLGYTPKELLALSSHDTWHKSHDGTKKCVDKACPVGQAIKKATQKSGECRMWAKDGHSIAVQYFCAPLKLGPKTTGLVISFFDITEQKEMARVLEESKNLLQVQFDRLPVACIIWSDQYTALSWNPMAEKIFGYSAREALGKKPDQLFIPNDAPENERIFWRGVPEGDSTLASTAINIAKNGRRIYCEWNSTVLKNTNGTFVGILSTAQDITDQVNTEEALAARMKDLQEAKASVEKKVDERTRQLAEAEAKENAILESIGDNIVAVDKRGTVIFANRVAIETVGLTEEKIIGRPYVDVWSLEDGSGTIIKDEDRPIALALNKNEKTEHLDYYFASKNKQTKFPAAIITAPIILRGTTIGAVEAIRDITKEKALERAKSDFVSIASHQLRTPLSAIRWVLDVLREEPLTPKQKEYVDSVYASNQRLVNLVDDLLNTSRIEAGNIVATKSAVSIKDTIASLLKTLEPAASAKNQKIVLSFATTKDTAIIDTKLFEMAFNNLVSNAIAYCPEGLPITISVSGNDGTCTVSVNNQKPIIPEAEKSKIFSKFYRADEAKKIRPEGTGLGVFIAKSSVETSGGKMWFTSAEGEGTTFYFTIPTK